MDISSLDKTGETLGHGNYKITAQQRYEIMKNADLKPPSYFRLKHTIQ